MVDLWKGEKTRVLLYLHKAVVKLEIKIVDIISAIELISYILCY